VKKIGTILVLLLFGFTISAVAQVENPPVDVVYYQYGNSIYQCTNEFVPGEYGWHPPTTDSEISFLPPPQPRDTHIFLIVPDYPTGLDGSLNGTGKTVQFTDADNSAVYDTETYDMTGHAVIFASTFDTADGIYAKFFNTSQAELSNLVIFSCERFYAVEETCPDGGQNVFFSDVGAYTSGYIDSIQPAGVGSYAKVKTHVPGSVKFRYYQDTTIVQEEEVTLTPEQWTDIPASNFDIDAIYAVTLTANPLIYQVCFYPYEEPTPTPTPTNTPTNTPTPTPTTSFTEVCSTNPATRVEGYRWTVNVPDPPPDNTLLVFHYWGYGYTSVVVTRPDGSQFTYSETQPTPGLKKLDIEIEYPDAGMYQFFFSGSPAIYGNEAEYTLCTAIQSTPTPEPTPTSDPPEPTPTTTPTPTATPTTGPEPLPTQGNPTATPAVWPTQSFNNPTPVATPAGCPPDDYFCGDYYYPVDGSLGELELDFNATYCVEFIPAIDIIDYEGLTICLETYDITASILDVPIPVVLLFSVAGMLIIYNVIRS